MFNFKSTKANKKSLSKQDVIDAFVWILGRDPESSATINSHLALGDIKILRAALLESEEFLSSRKFFRFTEKWVLTSVYNGCYEMWLDLHDLYVSYGCLQDCYEPIETNFIKNNVKPHGNYVDIGANIGWHTLGLAQLAGSAGKVYAFEPRKPTTKYLSRTIMQNSLSNIVKVFDFGLWNEEACLNLSWSQNTDNPGGSFVSRDSSAMVSQEVMLKKLDDIISERVDFIKIDVEGAEPRVFEGAARVIKDSKPLILAEINPAQLKSVSNVSAREFIAQMKGLGYKCKILDTELGGKMIDDFQPEPSKMLINVIFEPI